MLWPVESSAVILIPESADDEARIRRATVGLREIVGRFRVFDMDMREHPTLGMTPREIFDMLTAKLARR